MVKMDYMARALALARQALGKTSPNPAVGAVIVKEGLVVGEGFTQPPGQAHAEVMALRQAGEGAQGATLYVTLEPCCFQGRTPPCTEAIVGAGVSQALIATLDPNPRVAGEGVRQLQAAGIATQVGDHEEEARELNESFSKFITTDLPFVIAKFAMSLDGKLATKSGSSQWITGEEARRRAHQLRAQVDAIAVGVNTVLQDDPALTARDEAANLVKAPLRVIVDSMGRLPPGAKLLDQPGRTLIAITEAGGKARSLASHNVEVVVATGQGGEVDLPGLLRLLGQRQVTSLLVEGGGSLLGSFFDYRLVDKVYAFIAPIIIGGKEAKVVAGRGVEQVTQALRLRKAGLEKLGEDVLIWGYL